MPKISHDEFIALATKRSEARMAKDFKAADEIKKKINDGGYTIEDSKDGSGGYSFSAIPDAPVSASVDVVSTMSPMKRKK